MKRVNILIIFSIIVLSLGLIHASNDPQVEFETELGSFVVEIYLEKAPITAKNFLKYVDAGRYNSSFFFRTVTQNNQPTDEVKIQVVQAAIFSKGVRFPAIPHETTAQTGVKHTSGAISMARAGPGTAQSSFFICIGSQPELDFGGKRNPDGQGFAAFGRVIKGMDVIKKIHKAPAQRQSLKPRIKVKKAIRLN